MFDMNQCKSGDKIVSQHGLVLEYIGIDEDKAPYRHVVRYPDNRGDGSRLDNGMVFMNKPLPTDHNIVGFAEKDG